MEVEQQAYRGTPEKLRRTSRKQRREDPQVLEARNGLSVMMRCLGMRMPMMRLVGRSVGEHRGVGMRGGCRGSMVMHCTSLTSEKVLKMSLRFKRETRNHETHRVLIRLYVDLSSSLCICKRQVRGAT